MFVLGMMTGYDVLGMMISIYRDSYVTVLLKFDILVNKSKLVKFVHSKHKMIRNII